MELREYLAVLARRWRLILALVVVCVAASAAVTFTATPIYQTQAQLFVAGGSSQLVQSYAQLVGSRQVTAPVVDELGLNLTPDQLAGRVSATVPTDTVVINVSAVGAVPTRTAAIANAVTRQLARVIQELDTSTGVDVGPVQVTVTREAQPPVVPTSPQPVRNIGLGLVVGLALAIGLAILRDKLEARMRGAEDVSQAAQLPVLATVPYDRRGATNPFAQRDGRAESFRQLRTNLRFAADDRRTLRTVLVTSAVAGEGKSSIAGNLAAALAYAGQRACLVDADLRSPAVADYSNLIGEAGLSTVLSGEAEVDDVVQPAGGGLDVVTSGVLPPNPSELLASQRMRELLGELSRRYDVVVLDASPVLAVTDAVVLAAIADGVVLVARAETTNRAHVAHAVEALERVQARVLGAVLNGARVRRHGPYAYGYRSGGVRDRVPAAAIGRPELTRRDRMSPGA